MKTNKQAVIDVGSNSVRLLVAECGSGNILPIYRALETTRLASGMTVSGNLSHEAMQKTINTIYNFNIKAIELGVQEVYIFATAAVRNAENANHFIEAVKERTSLDVHVLSKNEEAEMGFIGVGGEGAYGIIDIGGASTEIMVGGGDDIVRCSLDMGAVSALELFPLGSVADHLTLEAMSQWTESMMKDGVKEILSKSQGVRFIGIGGTITTIVAMELSMAHYDPMRIQGKRLTIRTVEKWYKKLSSMSLSARRTIAGLPAVRADIIIGGITILLTFMKTFSLTEIRVSDSGNLEGYLKTKLANKSN